MAKVMADQQGWVDPTGEPEEINFVGSSLNLIQLNILVFKSGLLSQIVNETFQRLRESVNDGSTAYFVRLISLSSLPKPDN